MKAECQTEATNTTAYNDHFHAASIRVSARACRNGMRRPGGRRTGLRKSFSFCGEPHILDGFEGREFDVLQLAVHALNLANVDVVDDIAASRINGHWPARTLRCTFHR